MHTDKLGRALENIKRCPPGVVWAIKIITPDSISVGIVTLDQVETRNGRISIVPRSLVRIDSRCRPTHKPDQVPVEFEVIGSDSNDESIKCKCSNGVAVIITRNGITVGIIKSVLAKWDQMPRCN
jgi:hypothetical protein